MSFNVEAIMGFFYFSQKINAFKHAAFLPLFCTRSLFDKLDKIEQKIHIHKNNLRNLYLRY